MKSFMYGLLSFVVAFVAFLFVASLSVGKLHSTFNADNQHDAVGFTAGLVGLCVLLAFPFAVAGVLHDGDGARRP